MSKPTLTGFLWAVIFPDPAVTKSSSSVRMAMRRTHNSSVLIVDELDESREVLRTALERRGLRVLEATHCADGLVMARLHRPDLIVLDLDAGKGGSEALERFAAAMENEGRLLVLGSSQWAALAGEFMAKPYHYKPLILRIEELLGLRRSRAAA